MKLATDGYETVPRPDTHYANYGFFPALPAATAIAMKLLGLGSASAAFVVNTSALFVFCYLTLRGYAVLGLGNVGEAICFLSFFLLSPWSLYDHIGYSEMIFNMAAMGTFVSWRREQYLLASMFGTILTATRVTGTFLPILLCLETIYLERTRLVGFVKSLDVRIFCIAAMPLGLLGFMTFLYFHMGDFFGYFHIQETGWGHAFRNPVGILPDVFAGSTKAIYGTVAFVVVLAGLIAGVALRRIPPILAVFALCCMLLPIFSTIDGQARYALAIFPVYLLTPAFSQTIRYGLLAAFLAGQFVAMYIWLSGSPILL